MYRHFTYSVTLLKNHKLIQTGPYSIVRHPGYIADILLFIGEHLITNSYLLSIANFINCYNDIQRIKIEDNLLEQAFGDEYLQYREQVKYALIPYVF